MKRIAAIALFAASTLAVAGNAYAQTSMVRATVPFNFTIGNKALPAGTYVISPVAPYALMVRNEASRRAVLTGSYGDGKAAGKPVLVFHRCGSRYFLAKVHGGPLTSMNVAIPTSKLEEKARRQETATRQSAALRSGLPEVGEIMIALK